MNPAIIAAISASAYNSQWEYIITPENAIITFIFIAITLFVIFLITYQMITLANTFKSGAKK